MRNQMLNHRFSLFLLPYSLLLITSYVFSYPITNDNIYLDYDLDPNQTKTFEQQVLDWEVIGAAGPNKTTLCPYSRPMLGGPGILGPGGYFMKKYSGLPPHGEVRLSLNIYVEGILHPNDSIILDIDGKTVSMKRNLGFSSFNKDICSQLLPWITPLWKFNHTSDTLVLKIIPQLHKITNTPIGIAQLKLFFTPKEANETEMFCTDTGGVQTNKDCVCPYNKYPQPRSYDPSSYDCARCHADCGQCFGPLATQCLTCAADRSPFSNSQCIKCFHPCYVCGEGGKCLMCVNGYYRRWDSTCTDQCPLDNRTSVNGTQICKVPCQPEEYYFKNGSCSKSCPAPLVKYTDDHGNFCDLPCPNDQYLYPDGSCSPSCKSPLLASNFSGNLECDFPCLDNQYLYKNGSCKDLCEAPLIKTKIHEVDMCISPCNDSRPYLYQSNKSCETSCDPPYTIKTEGILSWCLNPSQTSSPSTNTNTNTTPTQTPTQTLSSSLSLATFSLESNLTVEEVRQIKTVSSAVESGGDVLGATTILAMVFGSANPAVSTMAAFVKMLPYIRYIDINYPPKLQLMLDNLNSSLISFSFGAPIPEELQGWFTMRSLPPTSKFEKYQFHSSFFVNYWPTMTSLVILIAVVLALTILTILFKRHKKVCGFIEGLKPIIQWNFALMIFCGNLDSVAIPTSLELRTVVFDSMASVISFIFCVILNGLAIFCFCFAYYIIRDIRKGLAKAKSHDSAVTPSPDIKWKKFQLFFKGSKTTSILRHMFIIPYLARAYLFNLIIANLYEHPLLEAIIIVTMSFLILASMIWLRPFISPIVFCQHVSDETLMLIVNISMLILAVFDHNEIDNPDARADIGNVIIYSNLAFSITANIYLIAYLFVGFKAAFKNFKKSKKKGFLSFLVALLAPYESGGMDMEITSAKEASRSPASPGKAKGVSRYIMYTTEADRRVETLKKFQILDSVPSNNHLKTGEETFENLLKSAISVTNRPLIPVNPLETTNRINPS